MSTSAIKISYSLRPPAAVDPTTVQRDSNPVPAESSTSFPIAPAASGASGTSKYYNALSRSVLLAQKSLNDDLTSWKDAIGDREKGKEDPGTIGYGRGKAAMMSEGVNGDLKGTVQESDEDEEDEEEA